jgi:hypothetical protein
MKVRVPSAVALLALALAACQPEPTFDDAQAAAPVDPAVAAAVSEARLAAVHPLTGKPRDAGAAFLAAKDTAAVGPGVTLDGAAPGAPSVALDMAPLSGMAPAGN